MKIGVNARFLIEGKLEGIGLFSHEIVKRLVQSHPEDQFVLFFDRPFSQSFIYGNQVKGVVVSPPARHPLLWWVWYEWTLPRAIKKQNIDVFLSPDGYTSLRSKVPEVMILHDLAYKHFSEHTPFLVQRFYHHFIPKYLQKAHRIGCVSEATRMDVLGHYDITRERLFVAYNGCRPQFKPLASEEIIETRKRYSEGHPYFLFVGALHPRKNVGRMLQAYELYRERGGSIRRFVIVGRRAWMTSNLEQIYERMQYRSEVIFTGYLDLQALAEVTGSAFALLYMSLFEGFGVPLLEAMNSDVPIITSDISSMPEVTGEASIKVSPTDIRAISDAMLLLSKDVVLRQNLIDKGRIQRQKFDWDTSAELIYSQLKELTKC